MYKKNLTWMSCAVAKSGLKINKYSSSSRSRSFILIFFFLLSASFSRAQVLKEQVNLKFTDTSLEKALQAIESKVAVRFVYNDSHMNAAKKVTGSYTGSLATVVEQILAPFQLDYDFVDNQYIVLQQKRSEQNTPSTVDNRNKVNQNGFVQFGSVVDENGNLLPNVIVSVVNAGNLVHTDANGRFNIGVIDDSYTLSIRSMGYKTVEIKSRRYEDLKIQLVPDLSSLDEVLVIGYGTTTRRNSTGSTVRVTSKDIMNTPTTNLASALQGRAAGVYVSQGNGLPGSPMTFNIRGVNSLISSGSTINRNAPLFIVDGIPFSSDAINSSVGTGLNGANGAASPLNLINPLDIESIDILKDADATAIYGSRAANGVVLITTKKGRAGKTQLDGMYRQGVAKVSKFLDLLNTEQYLAIRTKAFENAMAADPTYTPESDDAFDLTRWDQNAYTDFQKLLIGNTAKTSDANISLSGGNLSTNFRLSGTFHKEGNVFVGDQGYRRSAVNFNLSHKTLNDRLQIGFSTIYSADNNDVSILDQTSIAYNLPPNYPLYNADGSLYWSGLSFGVPRNPLGDLNQTVQNKGSNLMSNLNFDLRIWKGLSFKTNLGYGKSDMDQKRLAPLSSMDPGVSTNVANSIFAYNSMENYSVEPQLDYNVNIFEGKLSTMVGGTWQYTTSRQPFYTLARDFISDDFLENIGSAASVSTSRSSSEYKYASLFGRVNYNWKSKYILNVNFRRDGSSRFAPDSRYGNFGSVGAAWNFSEETWLKSIDLLSFGKLRASYGWVGNDKIQDYGYFDSYRSVPYVYNGLPGMVPSRLPNSNFRWETSKKLETGLELGFLNDRISLITSFYRNLSGDQLINYSVSGQAGFTSYQANFPALVENKGWEFTLNTQNINTKDFSWRSSFNISLNRNKLAEYPDIERSAYSSQLVVGHPMNPIYAYRFTGFDQTTGMPTFEDLNGDGNISFGLSDYNLGDRFLAGTTLPKYFGGFSNTLSYKNVTLDFLFQFVNQKGRSFIASSFYPPGYSMNNYAAQPALEYINAGLPSQPQVAAGSRNAYIAWSNYVGSDAVLTNTSFIRLKNVSLSYDIKGDFVERLKFKNLRLQVQGHNLFTVTDYFGYDPESQGLNLPPLRTIVGTLQFTF
ncbi:SusC/RagA family TonB-linked outer membrane protein [Sphingobacterium alkalisoli]|nr:SusC/RagA family TonB-linked outer membrane protein [Sphingobacterium alkalisoli]